MRILVTGGAGYIGSHTTVQLLAAGHQITIVDDFSTSKRSVIGRIEEIARQRVAVDDIDLVDPVATSELFDRVSCDAVIHFAGRKSVKESVEDPLLYYATNIGSTVSLLAAMRRHGVRRFVFSSSATVYGDKSVPPMREDYPVGATNPYGWTKVMQERMLRDLADADPTMRIAVLRYFNPVGAHPSGRIGEDPHGEPTNLVPLIARVAIGRQREVEIFGDDYPTPDGTGCRDYLHVEDLAAGHIAALNRLGSTDDPYSVWNLGTGSSTSVRQMVTAFSAVVGRDLPTRVRPRRPGDVADSYADPARAATELGWTAERSVAQMCQDTWRWQSANPDGYPVEE